jgi:hypothetical protein
VWATCSFPRLCFCHHHHISVMGLGHLLTRSGLTYPEVSSKVCHDSFCQLGNSVSSPWVIYNGAFYLHVVSSFFYISVICLKFVLFLIPLQFVHLFCNQSKFILLFFSCISSLLLLFFCHQCGKVPDAVTPVTRSQCKECIIFVRF